MDLAINKKFEIIQTSNNQWLAQYSSGANKAVRYQIRRDTPMQAMFELVALVERNGIVL